MYRRSAENVLVNEHHSNRDDPVKDDHQGDS